MTRKTETISKTDKIDSMKKPHGADWNDRIYLYTLHILTPSMGSAECAQPVAKAKRFQKCFLSLV